MEDIIIETNYWYNKTHKENYAKAHNKLIKTSDKEP